MSKLLNSIWTDKEEEMVLGYWEGRKSLSKNSI